MAKYTAGDIASARAHHSEMLHKGDTVYAMCHHVSRSGMSRHVALYIIHEGCLLNISHWAALVMGWPLTKSGRSALRVSGAGMDMGFHTVYSLASYLFQDGDKPGDGYALQHENM